MSAINTGRIVLGGLVAGLVINVGEFAANMWVFAAQNQHVMERFRLNEPGVGAMTTYVITGFVAGIVLVWLYAAIRPRFGPGPKTAVMAGVVTWFFMGAVPTISFMAMEMIGRRFGIAYMAWAIVEVTLAALIGGRLYSEGSAAAPVS